MVDAVIVEPVMVEYPMEPPVRLFTSIVLTFMAMVLMDEPTNVEYVNALVKRELIDPVIP